VRGGHYWAFIRDTTDDEEENGWFNFNDHNVKPINNEEDVQAAEAYMLLYQRKS
jgi:ubiquitin C-terminal hydrolase